MLSILVNFAYNSFTHGVFFKIPMVEIVITKLLLITPIYGMTSYLHTDGKN